MLTGSTADRSGDTREVPRHRGARALRTRTLTLLSVAAALYRTLPGTKVVLVLLGWCWSERSALLTTPKVLTGWPGREGTPGEGRCSQRAAAGRGGTAERTGAAGRRGAAAVCAGGAGTAAGAGRAQRPALSAETGLASAAISRCGGVRGLCFWRNKFQDVTPSRAHARPSGRDCSHTSRRTGIDHSRGRKTRTGPACAEPDGPPWGHAVRTRARP